MEFWVPASLLAEGLAIFLVLVFFVLVIAKLLA
jgi:hypothetical protein